MFIVIGGIFLPASMLAFTSVMSNFSTPDHQVTARFLAEKKMEELTKDNFITVTSPANQPYIAVTGYPNYQWTWTVCNTGSSQINLSCSAAHNTTLVDYSFYKRIEVAVLMPGNFTYDVKTIISRRPRS